MLRLPSHTFATYPKSYPAIPAITQGKHLQCASDSQTRDQQELDLTSSEPFIVMIRTAERAEL